MIDYIPIFKNLSIWTIIFFCIDTGGLFGLILVFIFHLQDHEKGVDENRNNDHAEQGCHDDVCRCTGGGEIDQGDKADDDGENADPCEGTFHENLLYNSQLIKYCLSVAIASIIAQRSNF